MSLYDMFSSGDSQNEFSRPGTGYYTANAPTSYLDTIHNYMLGGALPDALPQTGAAPSKNQAPNYSLGGVNTGMTNSSNWNPLTNSFLGLQPQIQPGAVDPALRQTLQSANAGGLQRGVSAFLGGFQPWALENHGIDGGMQEAKDAPAQWQSLRDLAGGVGFNARPYGNNNMALYDAMNDYTKDYYNVAGLSGGWTGGNLGNAAARTLYKDVGGGNLNPVSAPRRYTNVNDDKGFIGKESLTALSLALPMFGGWAGMLGSGTAGTLSAGSGLGLTTGMGSAIGTGATNMLVNAGMNAAMNGSGGQGFLGSLAGGLGGSALGSLTGSANNLGSLFDTAGAGASTLNPMGYFNSGMRNIGLGGSPLGQGMGLMNNYSRLANLWSK